MALPVFGSDEAGYDGRAITWGTAKKALAVSLYLRMRDLDFRLKVAEGLVTKEPLPLTVDGVAERCIGEDRTGLVVCVEARYIPLVSPVGVV